MAGNAPVEKIYDMSIVGGDKTYKTFDDINKLLIEMRANKQALGTFSFGGDSKEVLDQLKQLTNETAKFGQIGKQMTDALGAAVKKSNLTTLEGIQGFSKFQDTVKTTSDIIAAKNGKSLEFVRVLQGVEKAEKISAQTTLEAEKTKTEAGKQSANAKVANAKVETEASRQVATASVAEAKVSTETAKQRQIETNYTIALAKEKERLDKLSEKETANLAKQQSAYAKLNNEYKEATKLAQDLGARKVLLEKDIAAGNNLQVNNTELARLRVELAQAQDKALGLHNSLLSIDQAVGKSQRNVGNYNSAVMAMSQILREAPSFAYSFSTGLMGISNNIPILVDEITRLKKVNDELKASGQSTIPIWKTLMGAFTSPVGLITIATAAITIFAARMTMAGNAAETTAKKISNFDASVKSLNDTLAELNVNIATSTEVELNKAQRLIDTYRDGRTSLVGKINAYSELHGMYPKILTDLTDEEKKSKQLSDAHHKEMDKLTQVIALKNKMSEIDKVINAELKVKAGSEDQMRQIIQDASSATQRAIQRGIAATREGYAHPTINDPAAGVDSDIANKYLDMRDRVLRTERVIAGFKKAQLDYSVQMANIELNDKGPKDKEGKEPHDYTNAILEAEKKLNDELALLSQQHIQFDMNEQKTIFDNTENSLQYRLTVYTEYAKNLKQLIKIQNDAEVKDVQDKLDKITEIEQAVANKKAGSSYDKSFFDKSGVIKPEEQTLLINKAALTEQLEVLTSTLGLKLQEASKTINQDVANITNSSINKMLKDIGNDTDRMIDEIKNRANKAREKVYGKHESTRRTDKDITKINDAENIDKDRTNIAANEKEQSLIQAQVNEYNAETTHDVAMEQLEIDHIQKLLDLKKKHTDLQTQLDADQHKQRQDNEKLSTQKIYDDTIAVISTFANMEMEILAKQDAYREQMAVRAMNWNKKVRDSETQSLAQKRQNEKSDLAAQEALEKKRAENTKRRAQTQEIINFVVASGKNFADHEFYDALGNEAVLAAEFAAKEALLSSAQTFGRGGDVPSNGGVFGGRSHSNGGTPFFFSGGRFEAEADELAIINKRSASSNTTMTVSGTPKQIASAINSYGGGHNFAPGATLHRFEWGGSLGANITPPSFIGAHYTMAAEAEMQRGEVYKMVMANNETLNKHAEVLSNHAQALQRESDKAVVLNPLHVEKFNDNHKKAVSLRNI